MTNQPHIDLQRAEDLCDERGARLTVQRKQILEIILQSDKPMGAYDILDVLRDNVPKAAPPTVYRALDFLLEQGLIHRLATLNAYVGCTHPEHGHNGQFFICKSCGRVEELEDDAIRNSLEQAVASRNFSAEHSVIEIAGCCSDCRRSEGNK